MLAASRRSRRPVIAERQLSPSATRPTIAHAVCARRQARAVTGRSAQSRRGGLTVRSGAATRPRQRLAKRFARHARKVGRPQGTAAAAMTRPMTKHVGCRKLNSRMMASSTPIQIDLGAADGEGQERRQAGPAQAHRCNDQGADAEQAAQHQPRDEVVAERAAGQQRGVELHDTAVRLRHEGKAPSQGADPQQHETSDGDPARPVHLGSGDVDVICGRHGSVHGCALSPCGSTRPDDPMVATGRSPVQGRRSCSGCRRSARARAERPDDLSPWGRRRGRT